jgi:hypothetical protein
VKLNELHEGEEYAVHRHNGIQGGYWASKPCRAKLLRVVQRHSGTRHYRECVVELLEASSWHDAAGTELELPPSRIWRPWVDQARDDALKAAVAKARDENTEAARDALGRLGLHNERLHVVNADPGEYGVTVSVSELVKLANRADHLVELERLVHRYRVATGSDAFRSAVVVWAQAHDFSMLSDIDFSNLTPSTQ